MLYVVCISGTFHETIIYQCFTKKSLDIVLTLAHVFSCEFGKMLKRTFFTEHFRATASEKSL